LWTDIDNIDVLYEGNKVYSNASDGIKHEISYDAVIRDNVVARNGASGFDVWLWGSQILIQNSSNVKVYRNLVEVSGDFGNGIGIINQDRGEGVYGPWHAVNNTVDGNIIVQLPGGHGQNGVVNDTDDSSYWDEAGNSFDRNSYTVANQAGTYWTSNDRSGGWDDIGDLGLEKNGERIVEQRMPMELSCDLAPVSDAG
jgi:hypothetical protein